MGRMLSSTAGIRSVLAGCGGRPLTFLCVPAPVASDTLRRGCRFFIFLCVPAPVALATSSHGCRPLTHVVKGAPAFVCPEPWPPFFCAATGLPYSAQRRSHQPNDVARHLPRNVHSGAIRPALRKPKIAPRPNTCSDTSRASRREIGVCTAADCARPTPWSQTHPEASESPLAAEEQDHG